MPHRRSLASTWRRIPERYRVVGTKCLSCGTHFFPPRGFCPSCRRKSKIEGHRMSGRGKIFSYSVIEVPQEGFELEVPYVLAIVELDEGPKLTAQVCDVEPEEVEIGMPVEVVFRKISEDRHDGIIQYGYKFSPIRGQNK